MTMIISSQIVLTVIKPLLLYSLTTDAYYTAPQLAQIQRAFRATEKGKETLIAFIRGKVCVMSRKDTNSALSTIHKPKDVKKRDEVKQ